MQFTRTNEEEEEDEAEKKIGKTYKGTVPGRRMGEWTNGRMEREQ